MNKIPTGAVDNEFVLAGRTDIGGGKFPPRVFVSSLPGRDPAWPCSTSDWGYSPKRAQALPLSRYWMRRFAAHCRRIQKSYFTTEAGTSGGF